jgi:hypothetical protein
MDVLKLLDEKNLKYSSAEWAPGPTSGELWILDKDKEPVKALLSKHYEIETIPTAFIVKDANPLDPNFKSRY